MLIFHLASFSLTHFWPRHVVSRTLVDVVLSWHQVVAHTQVCVMVCVEVSGEWHVVPLSSLRLSLSLGGTLLAGLYRHTHRIYFKLLQAHRLFLRVSRSEQIPLLDETTWDYTTWSCSKKSIASTTEECWVLLSRSSSNIDFIHAQREVWLYWSERWNPRFALRVQSHFFEDEVGF